MSDYSVSTAHTDDGVEMRYLVFGHGEKNMVIIPGLSLTYVTDAGEALCSMFSSFREEYTVYLFDMPENMPEDYSLKEIAEDTVSVIRALKIPDIYLYGASAGGMISQYICGTYPEMVNRAAIVSSLCVTNGVFLKVLETWISLASMDMIDELTDNVIRTTYSKSSVEKYYDVLTSFKTSLTEDNIRRFRTGAKALYGMDFEHEAEMIRCPVLVIGAENDITTTADGSRLVAEKTRGELFMYGPEYGHAVYDEAPDFIQRLKDFFDRRI